MSEPGFTCVTDIRVRYAETDGMRVVYHGNYLTYFEQARTEMLRAMGLPYAAIEAMGIFVVVVEAHVHYRRPAAYDDRLQVRASVRERPTNRIRIEYAVTRGDDPAVLVDGYTMHAFLDARTGRPVRPPKEFETIMQSFFP
ncbi:MAG: acyl-CoA thioesterase [Bacteroidetes bacterium]|nr:MAG: acyl-CoA thioesterase [Bacteroidota bacterium]